VVLEGGELVWEGGSGGGGGVHNGLGCLSLFQRLGGWVGFGCCMGVFGHCFLIFILRFELDGSGIGMCYYRG